MSGHRGAAAARRFADGQLEVDGTTAIYSGKHLKTAAYPVHIMTNHDPIDIAIAAMRLYAETHPRPPHVTQAQAAEMLGLSAPTVRRLVRSGVLRLNRAGMIPIGEIDRAVASGI